MNAETFKIRVLSLTDKLYPMITRLLGDKFLAEDAIQEIMIKLWAERKRIEDHPNLNGFVFKTARNFCLDILKKKGPIFVSDDLQINNLEASKSQESFEWNELKKTIEEIVETLPKQQKEILLMRDIDGWEYSEIAEATQIKVEHIRVLLSRARKHVALALKKMEYDRFG